MSHLLYFYGKECPHCEKMKPLIDQFEKEENKKVERMEVWYDEANMARMNQYDTDLCGGVPFFFNTDTKKSICGEASLEELKDWAGE